jgi:hypothetical protein
MEKKRCRKCEHEWIPRKEKRIRRCPNCFCVKWDTYKPKSIQPSPIYITNHDEPKEKSVEEKSTTSEEEITEEQNTDDKNNNLPESPKEENEIITEKKQEEKNSLNFFE